MQGTRVTINTAVKKAIMVQTNNHCFKFKQCQNGLYYIDMSNIDNHKSKKNITSYPNPLQTPVCLLNTVDFNKSLVSKRQVKKAESARLLEQNLGWPGPVVFKKLIQNNLITNCNINVDDVERGTKIFGIPPPLLKGRMTAPPPLQNNAITIDIPQELRNIHKNPTLH